jgi:signal transduction histidine kinase
MTTDDFDRLTHVSPAPRPEPSHDAEVSREALGLLAEYRDRLARDLNDTLIRQMFAVSLDLHAALSRIDHDFGDRRAADKIRKAINGLDQAITDLRNAIVRRDGHGASRTTPTTPGSPGQAAGDGG